MKFKVYACVWGGILSGRALALVAVVVVAYGSLRSASFPAYPDGLGA
jgi:hypothetical protein